MEKSSFFLFLVLLLIDWSKDVPLNSFNVLIWIFFCINFLFFCSCLVTFTRQGCAVWVVLFSFYSWLQQPYFRDGSEVVGDRVAFSCVCSFGRGEVGMRHWTASYTWYRLDSHNTAAFEFFVLRGTKHRDCLFLSVRPGPW